MRIATTDHNGKLVINEVAEPGETLGFGGIAEAADGKHYYFYDAQRPASSQNEKIDLDSARTIALPDNIDPSLAAALGVPGLAAYSAVVFSLHQSPRRR